MTKKYTITYRYDNKHYKTEWYARSKQGAIELFKMWHRNDGIEIVSIR